MVTLDRLVGFLDTLLGNSPQVGRIDPHMANGLQVRGRDEVQVVVTGVSASLLFFEEAVRMGADALIVHHSLHMPASIHFDRVFVRRLQFLLEHSLSLIGYHYLLDSHPELGNNAQILKQLGAQPVAPYTADGWGWLGEFAAPVERDHLFARCSELFLQPGVQYAFGPKQVKRVVALSGSGAPRAGDMEWLISQRVDLFVTGEPREWCRELFREAGINLVAAGHYPTERLGIMALSDVLRRELDVTVHFLDLHNPV